MKVEQCVITASGAELGGVSYGVHAITSRVWLDCELVEPPDGDFLLVRLLEAGAGLAVNDEITVHASKVDPEA